MVTMLLISKVQGVTQVHKHWQENCENTDVRVGLWPLVCSTSRQVLLVCHAYYVVQVVRGCRNVGIQQPRPLLGLHYLRYKLKVVRYKVSYKELALVSSCLCGSLF